MAVTSIHSIKSTLNKAIIYITNPNKTDGTLLVSGYNCEPLTAHLDFKMTELLAKEIKGDYTKTGGSNNLAYHLMQSFAKFDKVTPEEAHEIGKRLADEFLEGKYEYVIATHIDKGHIHNHIIINSVSFLDYKKLRTQPYKTAHQIRQISDRLCEQKGLHVIKNPKGKGRSRIEWEAREKGTSWKAKIEKTIDEVILKANDYNEFKELMQVAGIEIKEGKHIAFRLKGQQKFTRGKTIGNDYTRERIVERIQDQTKYKGPEENKEDRRNKEFIFDNFAQKVEWTAKKQAIQDTKELANTLLLIRSQNINGLLDFDTKINELKSQASEIKKDIKTLNNKNTQYKEIAKYLVAYNKYLPIKLEYEKQSFLTKKNYYKKYESEILAFEYAEKQLQKLEINTNVDVEKVLNLINNQTERISELTDIFNKTESRIYELIKSRELVRRILNQDINSNEMKREKQTDKEL